MNARLLALLLVVGETIHLNSTNKQTHNEQISDQTQDDDDAMKVLLKQMLVGFGLVSCALFVLNTNSNHKRKTSPTAAMNNRFSSRHVSTSAREEVSFYSRLHGERPLSARRARIFCLILTTAANLATRARVVHETWASKCDAHAFIAKSSNDNNATTTHDSGMNVIEPRGLHEDVYANLTLKVQLAVREVHERLVAAGDYYDWFLKADDDTFVFVENMRSFVAEKNSSSSRLPLSYGYDFRLFVAQGYHSGGAGYLMSGEAFARLGAALSSSSDDLALCPNTGNEDVDMGSCMRSLGIVPAVSLDDKKRERFHPLALMDHYLGFDEWLHEYASNPVQKVLLLLNIFCCHN